MPSIEELLRRLSQEPNNPVLYYTLGKVYAAKKQHDKAIAALENAVRLAPQDIGYRLLLAKTYVTQNEYAQAREQYLRVLSANPTHVETHMNLGLLLDLYLGERTGALVHYRKYVELGGDDARIRRRIQGLRQAPQTKRSPQVPATEPVPEIPKAPYPEERHGPLHSLLRWRDVVARTVAEHRTPIWRLGFFAAAFLVLLRCSRGFPIPPEHPAIWDILICLALAGVVALRPRLGLAVSLALMFFPIAYHNPLLGWVYAAAAFLLLVTYVPIHPGMAIILLLTPMLLQAKCAYAIPLGAAVLLGAGVGARIGIAAALAGLGYMIAMDVHQLGVLSVNHEGTAILASTAASDFPFWKFEWLKMLSPSEPIEPPKPELKAQLHHLADSVYPHLFTLPIAFIQITAWGAAGYAAGRLYHRQRPLTVGPALGAAATILVVQGVVIVNLSGTRFFSSWAVVVSLVLSSLLVCVLVFFKIAIRGGGPGEDAESLGDVSWDSIGGLDDVKQEIQMVTSYQFESRSSRLAKRYGLKEVKGILFYGPPGCGKTLFAKALAKQVGASFFPVKGPDFRSMWYGESEKHLARIFEKARQAAPAVLFFDEIDNLLGKRGETMTSDSPEKRLVALFLSEMDGVQPLRGVLVVGATNEPDLLDPAALRPGRFDKLIYIPLPDVEGREKIFRVHLAKKPLAEDVNYRKLASLTERFSGADVADVCSKVAEQAVQESLQTKTTVNLSQAALEAQIRASKPSVSLNLLRKYEDLQEKYSRRTLKSETGAAVAKTEYSWEHIGGLEHVKRELVEAIETPLKKPDLYDRFGIKPPRGVLLYGPPGCGKTLMAKIVACQSGAHFLIVDIKKETADGIKEWFIRARENKPSILFFDEIDSIATSRGLTLAGAQGVVAQLLVELDGMEELRQVVVIGATNRPDQLDSALMRPGRFDRLVYIPPPDEASRLQVLRIHLRGKPLADDVDLSGIAAKTQNYSGADLAALCYEASMSLIRKADEGHDRICMADISLALQKVKPSVSPDDLAYFDTMKARYSRG